MFNEKKVSRYIPSIFGLRTKESSESAILIFGWVLACAGSGVNKVIDDFGVDINSELICKNWTYPSSDLVFQFRNFDSRYPHGYVTRIENPLDWFCQLWYVSYVETE